MEKGMVFFEIFIMGNKKYVYVRGRVGAGD